MAQKSSTKKIQQDKKSTRKPVRLTSDKKTSDASKTMKAAALSEEENSGHEDISRLTDFWEDLRDSFPPWLDEIIAIALLIFGILSFLALVAESEAIVAVAWADIMTTLFGYGSLLISAGLFALGIILWLPHFGLRLKLSSRRVLAVEIAFLCLLALFHLVNGDEELRAVARAGEGGGLIGWGLSFPFYWMLGQTFALSIYGVTLIISIGIIIGIRREHIQNRLKVIHHRLQALGEKLTNPALTQSPTSLIAETPLQSQPAITTSGRRASLMRIKANPQNLPPSLRPGAQISQKVVEGVPADASDGKPKPDLTDHPLFSADSDKLQVDYNIIGEKTGKKSKGGFLEVKRPDGRTKRYFTVSSMKEATKVARRDKRLPELDLLQSLQLNMPEEDEINHNVVLIENTLLEFDIDIDVVDVQVGPTVTRYAIQPFKLGKDGKQAYERTRLSKIAGYANDLALALSAKRLRLETPVPGTNYMGIEVPNKNPSVVALRSVYESRAYYDMARKNKSPLFIPLGRDVSGQPAAVDLATLPHLLIAGTTGSGKSVCIAAIASALVLNNTPDRVKLVMLDPKMVELGRFNNLPHLLGPVETETERIIGVLRWCTREMDRRYKLLEEKAARNIEIYNSRHGSRRRGGEYLPYIVVLIDEIGDLMLSRPEETEKSVTRLAQMARAVGIHLVVATQRPSVDVITGLIKANFPARIAFSVASGVDSRVILDTVGAETLLGQGDMLYLSSDASGPKRIQGCYVSDNEVRKIVQRWHEWNQKQIAAGKVEVLRVGPWERGLTRREFLSETDPMLEDAIELVVQTQEASASMIQRRLGLGYPRAARIMDMMEDLGVVGDPVGGGRARRVMIPKGQDPFKEIMERRLKEK